MGYGCTPCVATSTWTAALSSRACAARYPQCSPQGYTPSAPPHTSVDVSRLVSPLERDNRRHDDRNVLYEDADASFVHSGPESSSCNDDDVRRHVTDAGHDGITRSARDRYSHGCGGEGLEAPVHTHVPMPPPHAVQSNALPPRSRCPRSGRIRGDHAGHPDGPVTPSSGSGTCRTDTEGERLPFPRVFEKPE